MGSKRAHVNENEFRFLNYIYFIENYLKKYILVLDSPFLLFKNMFDYGSAWGIWILIPIVLDEICTHFGNHNCWSICVTTYDFRHYTGINHAQVIHPSQKQF